MQLKSSPTQAQSWINQARQAASGGNAQPWHIEFEENEHEVAFSLSIDKQYQVEPSAMDIEGVASVISLGCLAHYLICVAEEHGFQLEVKTFQVKTLFWDSSAQLLFVKNSKIKKADQFQNESLLIHYTDRTAYQSKVVPAELKKSIADITAQYSSLNLIEVPPHNSIFQSGLRSLEKIRWINEKFLASTLKEIIFKNDPQQQVGIPVNQLGVPKVDQILLRLMQKSLGLWLFLLKLGFAQISVYKGTVNFFKKSTEIYFLQTHLFNFENAFELGLCFQQIWLKVNSAQLAFQPNGNSLIALGYWTTPEKYNFSKYEIELTEKTTQSYKEELAIDLKKPVLGFRIGWPERRSEKTPRKPLAGKLQQQLIEFIKGNKKSSSIIGL